MFENTALIKVVFKRFTWFKNVVPGTYHCSKRLCRKCWLGFLNLPFPLRYPGKHQWCRFPHFSDSAKLWGVQFSQWFRLKVVNHSFIKQNHQPHFKMTELFHAGHILKSLVQWNQVQFKKRSRLRWRQNMFLLFVHILV